MEFTKEFLNNFKDSGKAICVNSKELSNYLFDYSADYFKDFSSRLYYYWRSNQRPIPLNIVFKIMEYKMVEKINIDSFSISGGNKVLVPDENKIFFYYFLGLLLGDGCMVHSNRNNNRNTYYVQICFRYKNEAIPIKYLIKNLFGCSSIYLGNGCYNLCIFSKPLVILLHNKYQIPIGLKYSSLRVPDFIYLSTIEKITAFVKGVFDSDGNLYNYKKTKGVQLRQKSLKFLTQLRELFIKIGVEFREPYYDKANNSWVLWSSKKDLVDNFIRRVIDFNINDPVAQPG